MHVSFGLWICGCCSHVWRMRSIPPTMRMELQSLFRERGSLSIHVNGEGNGVFVVNCA